MRIGSVGVLTAWLLAASSSPAQAPESVPGRSAAGAFATGDGWPVNQPGTLPGAGAQPAPPSTPLPVTPPAVVPPSFRPVPAPNGTAQPFIPPAPIRPVPPAVLSVAPIGGDCGNGGCGNGGCGTCGANGSCATCDEPTRMFVNVEYLLWWFRRSLAPPLVEGAAPIQLGQQGFNALATTTFFPKNSEFRWGPLSGVRLSGGMWFNDTVGVDSSGFYLPKKHDGIVLSSAGDPVLGRPILNLGNNTPTLVILAAPNRSFGGVAADSTTQLWGADGNLRIQAVSLLSDRFDLLFGFRYLELKDNLSIQDTSVQLADGTSVSSLDSFQTRNRFYGGQVGGHAHFCCEQATLDVIFKMAMGDMRQESQIDGVTSAALPGLPPVILPGGLLALPTNIGENHKDKFVFVPELTVNLGYRVTRSLTATVGYNLLYVTSVLRAGNDVDLGVNPTLVPFFNGAGAVPMTNVPQQFRPAFLNRASEFFAQGLNFGLTYRF
jgi:hypothetical protein